MHLCRIARDLSRFRRVSQMQCICLIGRHIIQVGTTIRQGKNGGYTSVNLCVKQARPGGKVAEASDAPDVRRKEGMEERSDQGDPRGQQLVHRQPGSRRDH